MSEAYTREEQYISAIADGTVPDLTPITRKEMFLAAAAGQNVTPPEPITREEMFLSKIQGGGGGDDVARSILDKTITEYSDSEITLLYGSAFYNCTALQTINLPSVTVFDGTSQFENCTSLENINMPLLERVHQRTFINTGLKELFLPSLIYSSSFLAQRCSKLERIILPEMQSFGGYNMLSECPVLTYIYAPKATALATGFAWACSSLEQVDLPSLKKIGADSFKDCTKLKAVVLRYGALVTLDNVSAFQNTPISNGNGYFYVPKALLSDDDTTSDYRVATNWSTYPDQFRALEDYTVDGTTTGELNWDKINA